MKEKSVSIITSEWEHGAGKLGSSKGPYLVLETFKNQAQITNNQVVDSNYSPSTSPYQNTDTHNTTAVRSNLKNGEALLAHQSLFAKKVAHQLSLGHRCLLFTADHSNGIGGVSGLCMNRDANFVGVIWIDAHYDLNSPYTTPSGNSHGMAVNALIDDNNTEHGEQAVTPAEANLWESIKSIKGMGNAIPPKNLVFIGVRDYEPAEAALVEKYGICSIHPKEIQSLGVDVCIQKALQQLSHCESLYVSLDVDSMDPSISIATGTPVADGLNVEQAKSLVQHLWNDDRTRCLEITEFNPTLPQPDEMLSAVREILGLIELI